MNELRQEVAGLCDMRYSASATVLIALTVLCLTSCSVSRKASSSERLLRTEATTRDTVWQQVVVAVHDTLREVTTITLQQNDQGDALKLVQVTDCTRASRSHDLREKKERTEVRVDTVYLERTDTLTVSSKLISGKPDSVSSKQTGLVPTLKWIFGILCALIVLVITLKLCLREAL